MSSSRGSRQTYGKYLVRFRLVHGYESSSYLMLMGSYQWPPEIDFAENGGENPYYLTAVLHYGPDDQQIFNEVSADFEQWHTIGVEWLPGRLDYTLDGQVWATVRGDAVPNVAMDFVMQTQAGTCQGGKGCPDATTPEFSSMQVDWVAVYAPA